MKDIKFDIKKFNNDMNKKIELNRQKRDELINDKINELNEKNINLEKMKENNEPYIKFMDDMVDNLKLILIDLMNYDIYKILNDDNKLLYLGIWFIVFALLIYVLSNNYNTNNHEINNHDIDNKFINEKILNNKIFHNKINNIINKKMMNYR